METPVGKPGDDKPAKVPEVVDRIDVREIKFVAEYVANGGNGTQAMLKIEPGMSEEVARNSASRLIAKANVQAGIERTLRAQIKRIDLKADRVLLELYRILTVDINEAFDEETGALKPLKEIPEDVRRAISGIEVDEIWETENFAASRRKVRVGETKKIKFWSKTEAAALLGKHLKLWVEKVGIEGLIDGVEFTLTLTT